MSELPWKTHSLETGIVYINELKWETWKMTKTTMQNILDEWDTLKNTFFRNGNCVYQWVTMRNMENDKNHTVELIRWVSYPETSFVETGIV